MSVKRVSRKLACLARCDLARDREAAKLTQFAPCAGGGQIATESQIPEGRILNMLEVPVQRATKILDAPPIEMDLNGNRAIFLPSRSESWRKRISSMGWLSTSIVHDLRNPLGTVFAGAEMLMQLDPASTQGKRLAANIYRAAVRMRELLADLADASCGNKSTCEMCKIRAVIIAASETALLAAESQGFEIVHESPAGLEIPVLCFRIKRVFFNQTSNDL